MSSQNGKKKPKKTVKGKKCTKIKVELLQSILSLQKNVGSIKKSLKFSVYLSALMWGSERAAHLSTANPTNVQAEHEKSFFMFSTDCPALGSHYTNYSWSSCKMNSQCFSLFFSHSSHLQNQPLVSVPGFLCRLILCLETGHLTALNLPILLLWAEGALLCSPQPGPLLTPR